ncbi:hypothetical protein ACIBFB_18645 [Nocardiopsis sp. NPDC050513]|uniref:hypothetical protein n=1 Tax=Nocardiopsis sp. NPDC050513 TaxID=3364338 RepID=UPI003793B0FA
MRVRTTTVLAPLTCLVLAGVLTTACTTDDARVERAESARREMARAAGALSATVLRPAAERAFARAGHPVQGVLTCANEPTAGRSSPEAGGQSAGTDGREEADREGDGAVEVHCTGTTRDGDPLVFEGRLRPEVLAERETGDDGLRGVFSGRVGGAEVFAMDCFQCAPALAGEDTGEGGPEPDGSGEAAGESGGGTG